MSTLSIAAKLGLDVAGYEAGIQKVTQKNSQLNNSFNGVKSGVGSLTSSLGSVVGVSGLIDSQLNGVIDTVSNLTSTIPSSFKKIGSGIKGMGSTITSGLASMFSSFSGFISSITAAVASTGIGAIIIAIAAALAGLVTWLKRTEEGSDALAKAFEVVNAVIATILNKLQMLGSAIVKLFSGDFKGAVEDAKAAITGWGDALRDNIEKGKKVAELKDEYEDFQATYELTMSKLSKKASEYALIMKDETYSLAERKEALKNYQAVQAQIQRLKEKDIQYQIDILKLEQSEKASLTTEDKKQLNDLLAQKVNIQTEYNNAVKETLKLQNSLNDQEKELTTGAILKVDERAWEDTREFIKKATKIEPTETDPFEGLAESAEPLILTLEKVTTMWGAMKDGIKSVINELTPTFETLRNSTIKAFGAVTQTLAAGANSFKEYGKAIKATIKQVVSSLIGEAVMTMVAAQLKKYAWLNPAIALGIATAAGGLVSTSLNAFASSVLKFNSGGIVPYNYYMGDMIPARVNSGEMILTTTQQRNLFSMLNGGRINNQFSGEVRFEIEGDKLVGVLNNYSKIQKRL